MSRLEEKERETACTSTLLVVWIDTPFNSSTHGYTYTSTLLSADGVHYTVDGYILQVYTAGGEEGYTLHSVYPSSYTHPALLYTAGRNKPYKSTVYCWWGTGIHPKRGGNGIQPARQKEIPKFRDNSHSGIGLFL
jgi:hypothetical protein